jgi:hypothetical protein
MADVSPVLGKNGSLTFDDMIHVERWLWSSLAGRSLLEKATAQRLCSREAVLIVCEHPNWLEIYRDDSVDVFAVNKLATSDGESATLAEEYVELTIPERFRPLLAQRPKLHLIERRTAKMEAERLAAVEELATAREMVKLAAAPS